MAVYKAGEDGGLAKIFMRSLWVQTGNFFARTDRGYDRPVNRNRTVFERRRGYR